MNNALAVLLADWVHHWRDDTDPDEKRLDILEAKQHLQGLVRLLLDEDMATHIGRRMYEHEFSVVEHAWEDITTAERNSYITKAQKFLDALKDEIMEDRAPTTAETMELDQILDRADEIGRIRCAWCGVEITMEASSYTGGKVVWVSEERQIQLCTVAPTGTHEPPPGG